MKKITSLLIMLLLITGISRADYTLTKTIGGVSVSTTVPEGRTVTLNYQKNSTQFSRWVVNSNNLTLTDPTLTRISFTMPASNVEITAEEVPKSYLLIVSVDGEIIEEVEKSAGKNITLTAIESQNKIFDKWTITGLTETSSTSNPLTFTMPNNQVTIIAEFKEFI